MDNERIDDDEFEDELVDEFEDEDEDVRIEEDEFVDSLRLQHNLTISDLFCCSSENYNDIQTMNRIFNYGTEEDVRRCMAVSRLLAPEWADGIIEYSRMEKFKKFNRTEEPDIKEYSLLLISSFFYNTPFLRRAWEWCVFSHHEAKNHKTPVNIINFPNERIKGKLTNMSLRSAADNAGILQLEVKTDNDNIISSSYNPKSGLFSVFCTEEIKEPILWGLERDDRYFPVPLKCEKHGDEYRLQGVIPDEYKDYDIAICRFVIENK